MIMGGGWGLVCFAVVVVAMSPQHQLFEDEEKHDAEQDRCCHAMWFAMFQRVRQNFQESGAQQGADRIGNQHVDTLRTKGRTDRSRCHDAQSATSQ